MLELQTFFTEKFTNSWCGEWLLVNEKMLLMVGLDETNKKLITSIVYKNIVK